MSLWKDITRSFSPQLVRDCCRRGVDSKGIGVAREGFSDLLSNAFAALKRPYPDHSGRGVR